MEAATANYAFGPFCLCSQISLPELPFCEAGGLPVVITVGLAPATITSPTFETQSCTASRRELLLIIPDVARYYIRDGCTVVIEPADGSNDLDIRGYLLGTIFAVLCHQRRLIPLHASAVRVGRGTVAFLGDSGAGKSTLAAFLAARGFPLVADDICLLDPDATPDERVLPVTPWLKLWRGSLEALGRDNIGLSRTFKDEDKFRLPTLDYPVVESKRLPLTALLILKKGPDHGAGTVLQVLNPAHSVMEAMRFTYQQYLIEWLGLEEEHFARCAMAIGKAKVFKCHRPWGFDQLGDMVNTLQAEFGGSE